MNKKSSFKFFIDYERTQNQPCVRQRCDGFMFKVLVQYSPRADVVEEWECFSCRKTSRIGIWRKGINERGNKDDFSRVFGSNRRNKEYGRERDK